MGRYDVDDEDDPQDEQDGGSSVLRDLRRALKAEQAKNKDLEAKLTQALGSQRERSVKDVLTARGLNPKIAAFVPSDLTDEASITKWIDDYADVFGAPTDNSPKVDPDAAAALQAMDSTMAGGSTPVGGDALIERVKTMPLEELERMIVAASGQ